MKFNENFSEERPYPEIIQGGMGVGVSNWRLARAVSREGELGVVSGTALDTVLIRRLQDGDERGDVRRAMAAFPYQEMVEPILKKWFQPQGRRPDQPYKLKPLPSVSMIREDEELLIVANFVEVYLAKEGHNGLVGINFLEKIQLPTLPSIFGAMLAEVDVVLMGGGIPLAIPGVLDDLSDLEPVQLKLNLNGSRPTEDDLLSFHPGTYVSALQEPLKRPLFFAIISSDVLAKTLVKKASGKVDGFIVEHYSAGGHNAPPRTGDGYGDRDLCDVSKVAELGRPFWLAGGCASPETLNLAKVMGAEGVQVGTAFALSDESGILPEIKIEMIHRYLKKKLHVVTDFEASPTGYPFKRVDLECNRRIEARRPCDLGYLRHVYKKDDGTISYRCPSTIRGTYLSKGGEESDTNGKRCLCNGLLATVGLGQVRNGRPVAPLVTCGEEFSFLDRLIGVGSNHYTARDVLNYLKTSQQNPKVLSGSV